MGLHIRVQGGTPEKCVINKIFPNKGKDRSWGGDPPAVRESLSNVENQGDMDPRVHEFGWDKSSQFQVISRMGAEFDKTAQLDRRH